MRFWYTNLIDASTATITAGTQVSTLPGSNVANALKKRVYRTGSSVATETLTFDLGSARSATSAIIFAHTLTASDTTIQLRGSTDNFSSSNVLVATFAFSSGAMAVTFSSASYRYWRITFTKSAAGQSRDIGRVFLGTYIDTALPPDYDGYERTMEDLSIRQESIDGQVYCDQRSKRRSLRLDFSYCPQAMRDDIATMVDSVGENKSFFFQVDTDPTAAAEVREIMYGRLNKLPAFKVDGYDSGLVWKFKLELEESL